MLRLLLAAAIVLAGVNVATAAQIFIVSMQYSVEHPVPHMRYEGDTEQGDLDRLRSVYESFVKCRIECLGPDGGATAVLSMSGPGGSYDEGLAMAAYLRQNAIATVIQRGDVCASACAFAFLGGSGYSSQSDMGIYVDRQAEPGGVPAFHSPYFQEADILAALEVRGTGYVMDENRNAMTRMVKELVQWNVDPEIIHEMMSKGPSETYDVVQPEDYYLTRTALPAGPATDWATDLPSAIRNACMRLLAIDERANPLEFVNFLDRPWQELGVDENNRPVSGFRWNDNLLQIGSCGMPDAAFGPEMKVALYFTPGLDGRMGTSPTVFWNRENGWSTAGGGHNPRKRILQKGPMNHFFLPLGVPVDDLELPGEWAMLINRFYVPLPPLMSSLDPRLEVVTTGPGVRISRSGDVWLFEQTGPKLLFDSAVADPGRGLILTNDGANASSFVREGTYPDGTPFKWFGFAAGDAAAVMHIFVSRTDGSPATPAETALMHELQCATDFQSLKLGCG